MKQQKQQRYSFSDRLFYRGSVTKQFRTLFLLIVVLPLAVLLVIISFFSVRAQVESYEHLAVSKSTQVRTVLATTATGAGEIRTYFSQDSSLQEILKSRDSEAFRSALYGYDGFRNIRSRYASVGDLRLYLDANILGTDSRVSDFYPISEENKGEDWYAAASKTKVPFWMAHSRTVNGVSYSTLCYYAQIPFTSSGISAILAVDISNDYLKNLISDSNYAVLLNVDDGKVFYSDNADALGNALPVETDATYYYTASGAMNVGSIREIASVVTMRPAYSNDRVHILVYDPNAFTNIRRTLIGYVFLIAAVIAVCGIVFYAYSRYSSTRILTLRRAMGQAAVGDYEIIEQIQGDDELTETFRDLRRTVETLKRNQAELYEGRLKEEQLKTEQRETELKLMASQINPHFLYNTLEMLRMKALIEGNRDLAGAIKKLGKIMRYVLGTTRTTATSLDKELDYIDSYLSIMKMRFGDRLSYAVDVSPEIDPDKIEILPLLIQPPCENAILHGIEESGRDGTVIITMRKTTGNLLWIRIADNGTGMSAEALEALREKLKGPHPKGRHGVGLYNVHHRIRLYYGLEYGLRIESAEGRGTSVTMELPVYRENGAEAAELSQTAERKTTAPTDSPSASHQ